MLFERERKEAEDALRRRLALETEAALAQQEKDLAALIGRLEVPYFFAYKTEFFSFQNSPENLDPSYKMDLDLWDCLGRVKLILQQKLHRTDLIICTHSRERNTPSYSRINTVFLLFYLLK